MLRECILVFLALIFFLRHPLGLSAANRGLAAVGTGQHDWHLLTKCEGNGAQDIWSCNRVHFLSDKMKNRRL